MAEVEFITFEEAGQGKIIHTFPLAGATGSSIVVLSATEAHFARHAWKEG